MRSHCPTYRMLQSIESFREVFISESSEWEIPCPIREACHEEMPGLGQYRRRRLILNVLSEHHGSHLLSRVIPCCTNPGQNSAAPVMAPVLPSRACLPVSAGSGALRDVASSAWLSKHDRLACHVPVRRHPTRVGSRAVRRFQLPPMHRVTCTVCQETMCDVHWSGGGDVGDWSVIITRGRACH